MRRTPTPGQKVSFKVTIWDVACLARMRPSVQSLTLQSQKTPSRMDFPALQKWGLHAEMLNLLPPSTDLSVLTVLALVFIMGLFLMPFFFPNSAGGGTQSLMLAGQVFCH